MELDRIGGKKRGSEGGREGGRDSKTGYEPDNSTVASPSLGNKLYRKVEDLEIKSTKYFVRAIFL